MRFDTLNARSYLVWRLQYVGSVDHIRDEGDILLVTLKTQEQIMIYLIERPIPISEVIYHFNTNTAANLATLLIFWVDMMLPRDGEYTTIDEWMLPLLTVHHNQIYGYEVAGREAYFFPIHFEGDAPRKRIRYGNIINYAGLNSYQQASWGSRDTQPQWLVGGFSQPNPRAQHKHILDDQTPLVIYFEILGIDATDDVVLIKQAYRRLARLYHPDVNTAREALFKMKQINHAYTHIMADLHKRQS